MATIASSLQSTPLKWNHHHPHWQLRQATCFFIPPRTCNQSFAIKHHLGPSKFRLQPCFRNDNIFTCLKNGDPSSNSYANPSFQDKTANPFEIIFNAIKTALKSLQKPAVAVILMGLLLMYNPISAFAASAGRMGGRAFRRSSSSSSSSSTESSSSSYRSYSVPRESSSSSYRSYSVPRESSSSSYWSHSVGPEFSYSGPSYEPSPFGGGGGVDERPAVEVGADAPSAELLTWFYFLIFIAALSSAPTEHRVVTATEKTSEMVLTAPEKTGVIKLQVGLLGTARSLQGDLNRIAEVDDTSSPEGLNHLLKETSLALLRHPDYCISVYSFVDIKQSIEDSEKHFDQLSIEERAKFDEETLVNVDNIKRQSTTSRRANGFGNDYIVITILVATEGEYKLPTINSSVDLKEALQKLGSIPTSKLLAVEVLWTPQNEDDTLSEEELLEDYPLLKPLLERRLGILS